MACPEALLAFALLEKREMRRIDVQGYVESVPAYRDLSDRFIGMAPPDLAEQLVAELIQGRAVVEEGGLVRPTMVA